MFSSNLVALSSRRHGSANAWLGTQREKTGWTAYLKVDRVVAKVVVENPCSLLHYECGAHERVLLQLLCAQRVSFITAGAASALPPVVKVVVNINVHGANCMQLALWAFTTSALASPILDSVLGCDWFDVVALALAVFQVAVLAALAVLECDANNTAVLLLRGSVETKWCLQNDNVPR